MARVAYETTTDGQPVRIVYVPDRFPNRFWAILTSLLFHPFTYTIIRPIPPGGQAERSS
jgi:hypothetical protein